MPSVLLHWFAPDERRASRRRGTHPARRWQRTGWLERLGSQRGAKAHRAIEPQASATRRHVADVETAIVSASGGLKRTEQEPASGSVGRLDHVTDAKSGAFG